MNELRDHDAWLALLKPGDRVLTEHNGFGSATRYHYEEVERVTKTQIMLKDDRITTRYNRQTGIKCGSRSSRWGTDRLYEATPERIAKEEQLRIRDKAQSICEGVRMRDLFTESLVKIAAIIETDATMKAVQNPPKATT